MSQQDNLSSKDVQDKALRDHIFARLRQPKYKNRDQAHTSLMPRLSGDGGTVPYTLTWHIEEFTEVSCR